MLKPTPTLLFVLTACFLSAWLSAYAEDPGTEGPAITQSTVEKVCAPAEEEMDKYRYLRALKLDLMGTVPTSAEYGALETIDDVPSETIDTMLASDEFAQRAVRAHRKLLWNNVSNVLLLTARSRIRTSGGIYYANANRAIAYRGENLRCLDEEAEFSEDGEIITKYEGGYQLDGWVEVNPYWAPDTTVKVCAFEAQTQTFSPSGTDCRTSVGGLDPGCGCGPNLVWCGTAASREDIRESFGKDVDLRIADLIRNNRPYTELFTHAFAYVNGPIVHYWRHWVELTAGIRNAPLPISLTLLPELSFDEIDTWVKVDLDPGHAGVLSSPGFLLRFQTNRGRASQFFTKFLCAPFQSPQAALSVDDETAQTEADLQKRDGCKYCHAVLEPAAAHWGRWAQQGAGYLNHEDFPPTRIECLLCAQTGSTCSNDCRFFYTVSPASTQEEAFLGQLHAYSFLREEHLVNVDQGPKLLALSGFADNRLTTCAASRVAEDLLGRQLFDEEGDWLEKLVIEFANSNYSYRELVRAVVTSPVYRRVR